MKRVLLLAGSHVLALGIGFALGIYLLPVLTAPTAPSTADAASAAGAAAFSGRFKRDLKDSDLLHWGEGTVTVGRERIALVGKLAPGPDYKLYLSPEFVETEADFARLKPRMIRIGDVRTFDNFVVDVPPSVDVSAYTSVIVWCETFSQFITAARYR
jgi:hypothetical protein